MDQKSNPKNFWNNHLRPLTVLLVYYMLSLTSSFGQDRCTLGDLPSISFRSKSDSLIASARSMLDGVADQLKNNPFCSIIVTGYPVATKAAQPRCAKRVAVIKTYFTEEKGISADRIITDCEVGGGDANTVDIKSK